MKHALRALELLRERGRLTNAEIRSFSGYSRQQVLGLEKELEAEGLIEIRGQGRGAHIVPVGSTGNDGAEIHEMLWKRFGTTLAVPMTYYGQEPEGSTGRYGNCSAVGYSQRALNVR